MAINLGGAFFDFTLNATNFVSGMAKVGSAVSDFSAKATQGYTKTVKASADFSKASRTLSDQITRTNTTIEALNKSQHALQVNLANTQRAYKNQEQVVDGLTRSTKAHLDQMDAFEQSVPGLIQMLQKAGVAQQDIDRSIADTRRVAKLQHAQMLQTLKQEQDAYDALGRRITDYKNKIKDTVVSRQTAVNERDSLWTQQRGLNAQRPAAPSDFAKQMASISTLAQGSAQALGNFAERTRNTYKTLDQFTMGWRGLSKEMQKARQEVYNTEAAQKAATSRVKQQEQALVALQAQITRMEGADRQRRAGIIGRREADIRLAKEELILERDKLSQMAKGTQAYRVQLAVINQVEAKIKSRTGELARAVGEEKREEEVLKRLKAEYAQQVDFLGKLKERQVTATQAVGFAKDKVKELIQSQKEKKKADEEAKKAQDKHTESVSLWNRILNALLGRNREATKSIQDMGRAAQQANGPFGMLSRSLTSMQTVLVGGAMGAAFSMLSGGLTSTAHSAFSAYQNHELFTLSMKNMAEAELQNAEATLHFTNGLEVTSEQLSIINQKFLERLALQSKFTASELQTSFQLAQAMGFTSAQTQRLMSATVDWASAAGKSRFEVEQVIRAFGQMHANVTVTKEDLNQLTNTGIGWRKVLEEEFRPEMEKSGKSLLQLISDGVVPADRAIAALTEKFEVDFKGGAAEAGQSMVGLMASLRDLTETGFRKLYSGVFEVLKGPLGELVNLLQNPETLAKIEAFGSMIGEYVGGAFASLTPIISEAWAAIQSFGPVVMDAFAVIQSIALDAYDWGSEIVAQLANGMWDAVSYIVDVISEIGSVIAGWMMPHSPPKFLPKIDEWGKSTMEVFFQGMSQANMGVFDDLNGRLKSFLNIGEDSGSGIIGMMTGGQKAIAAALQEFQTTGNVADSTFGMIRIAAGTAGASMESYARAVFGVQKAQKELNDATKKYDDRLKPLQDRLLKIRAAQESRERKSQIKGLQDQLGAKQAGGFELSDKTKSDLNSQIETLQIEDQIAALELERDTALQAAQAKVDSAQKELEARQLLIAQQDKANELAREQIALLERVARGQEKAAAASTRAGMTEEQRLDEQEFRNSLIGKTTEEQIDLYNERLAGMEQGTVEYAKVEGELLKLKQKAAAESEKLNDKALTEEEKIAKAQFESELATMSRTEKIDAYQKKLATLTEGTQEYYETEKKLNTLLKQEQDQSAKGGGAGAGKGGGAPIANRDLTGSPLEQIGETTKVLADNLGQVSKRAQEVTERIRAFFRQIRDTIAPFQDVIMKIGSGILAGLAIEKVLVPLLRFVAGLRQFVTWTNLGIAAIAGFAYIVANDIGGVREIFGAAFDAIGKKFEFLMSAIGMVKQAFEQGGLAAAFSEFVAQLPGLISTIGGMGTDLMNAIITWAKPFVDGLIQMGGMAFDWFVAWLADGGLQKLLPGLVKMFTGAVGGLIAWALVNGVPILAAGLGEVFGLVAGYLQENVPLWIAAFQTWLDNGLNWLRTTGLPGFISGLGFVVGALPAALIYIIPDIVGAIMPMVRALGKAIIPQVPVLLGGAIGAIITFLATSIPVFLIRLVDLIKNELPPLMRDLGPVITETLFNLGRMFGNLLSQLIIMIIPIIGGLLVALWNLLSDQEFWVKANEGFQSLVWGIIKGAFGFVLGMIMGLVEPLVAAMRAVANDMIGGLDAGWKESWAFWWFETVVKGWDAAMAWIKDLLGISSPSTWFYDLATNMIRGLQNGWNLMWVGFNRTFQTAWTNLRSWVHDLLFGSNGLVPKIIGAFEKFKADASRKVDEFKTYVEGEIKKLVNNVVNLFNGAEGMVAKIIAAFVKLTTDIQTKLGELPALMQQKIDELFVGFQTIGQSIVDWVLAGLTSNWDKIGGFIKKKLDELKEQFLNWVVTLGNNNKPSGSPSGAGSSGGDQPPANDTGATPGGSSGGGGVGQSALGGMVGGRYGASFVGERGVELFAPKVSGAIVTNQRLMQFLGSMVQEPTVLQALNQLAGGGGINYSGAGASVNVITNHTENYILNMHTTDTSRGVVNDFNLMKATRKF